jgi:hypothetical protein
MAAVVLALVSLLVPLLSIFSSSVIALVTLRKGYKEGLAVLGFATLASGLLAFLLFSNPAPALAFVLLLWMPPLLLAQLLRVSMSLALTITAALLVGLLVIGVIHLQMPDPVAAWKEILEPWSQELADAGLFSEEDRALFVEKQAPRMTGMLAAASALQLMLSLLLARWWQAMLFNPGGFRAEFHGLRLPKAVGVGGLLLVLLSFAGITGPGALFLALSLLVGAVFILQGLAVIHAIAAARSMHPAWLVGLYVLWVFAMLPVTVALVAVGLADIWLDFRTRVKRSGQSMN